MSEIQIERSSAHRQLNRSEGIAKNQLAIIEVVQATDDQTLVIQYDDPSDLNAIKSIVHNRKHSNAQSYIDRFREIDIFVNIGNIPGKPWLRIVYECLSDNQNPSPYNSRFPGAYIIKLSRSYPLDRPVFALDTLLEGSEARDEARKLLELSDR